MTPHSAASKPRGVILSERSERRISNRAMPEGDKKFIVQVARYSQLALTLPAATVVGLLIGYLLDKWLHTTWLYIAGLIVGIAAGFIELVRTVSSSEEKS